MITQVERWWSLIQQNPGPIIICSVSALLVGISMGYGIGHLIGSYGHDNTKRELNRCERDIEKKDNDLISLRAELDTKKIHLQQACEAEDLEKLKNDIAYLKTSNEKCEKDVIERDKSLAQAQKEDNVLRNRSGEVEGKNRTQLARIDSLQVQYDKAAQELSRCQRMVNDPIRERCNALAKQIHEDATNWSNSPDEVDEKNRPLYKQRKELRCGRFAQ